MGFEAEINSEKPYNLSVTREFCPFYDKNLLNLECFRHRHLNRTARPSNRGGGKKVTGQLLIYTKSQDIHV